MQKLSRAQASLDIVLSTKSTPEALNATGRVAIETNAEE
jgi:hypothetical protein